MASPKSIISMSTSIRDDLDPGRCRGQGQIQKQIQHMTLTLGYAEVKVEIQTHQTNMALSLGGAEIKAEFSNQMSYISHVHNKPLVGPKDSTARALHQSPFSWVSATDWVGVRAAAVPCQVTCGKTYSGG